MIRFAGIVLALIGCCQATHHDDTSLRISGGSSLDIRRVPYQVAVEESGKYICGGSIINYQWVLTSAECIDGKAVEDLRVRAGTSFREEGGDEYSIQEAVTHTKYDREKLSFNVGLVKTKGAIATSPSVQEIDLVEKDKVQKGNTRLLVTGWGKLDMGEYYLSKNLTSLSVGVVPRSLCKLAYTAEKRVLDETTLCAIGKKWKGVCDGDAGSPLVNNVQQLVGVSSWEKGCGHPAYPSVFTSIAYSEVRDWIDKTITT